VKANEQAVFVKKGPIAFPGNVAQQPEDTLF